MEARIKNYLKERNIPIDSLEANSILEGYELAIGESLDYWTRLEHQYAGMVMQGMLARSHVDGVIEKSVKYAHTLVEKLKKEEMK